MKVKIRRNDLFMEGTCLICGEEFPPDIIIATAYSDDGKKSYGDVCPKCIYEGPEAAQSAVQEQIQNLRNRAERLLAVAADLAKEVEETVELPGWEDWRNAHLNTFLQQIGMGDNEQVKQFPCEVKIWDEAALQEYLAQTVEPAEQDDPYQQALYAIAWHEREKRFPKLR